MRKLVSIQKIKRNYELKPLRVSRNYDVDIRKNTFFRVNTIFQIYVSFNLFS
jgi:hypothetical protein